ncbi:hypothetical protein HBI38_174100 [Parastagonospora nodorum]|nr:hypothetical protein HBH92_170450 [Parastagonospora nodorum]KAH4428015.1 hypothetical protein HBH93_164590 [Parastagonospora nodorum]KAH4437952.1 hypothetical protein HBH91_188400 [Parastagonospora nodorum]KAH4498143.1 hypothetical protein HBH89_130620 [Parastagonospora nodorum]KAH4533209.1 hypothetical protein HBH85_172900 [Parastagonospora nodorum]
MVGASNTWPPTSRDERAAEQVPSRTILSADFNPHPLSLHILSDEELYKPGFLVELDNVLSLVWRRRIRGNHKNAIFGLVILSFYVIAAIGLGVGAISLGVGAISLGVGAISQNIKFIENPQTLRRKRRMTVSSSQLDMFRLSAHQPFTTQLKHQHFVSPLSYQVL